MGEPKPETVGASELDTKEDAVESEEEIGGVEKLVAMGVGKECAEKAVSDGTADLLLATSASEDHAPDSESVCTDSIQAASSVSEASQIGLRGLVEAKVKGSIEFAKISASGAE